MADLTREELAAVHRAGDLLSEQFTNRNRPTVTRRLGSVTAVAQDGSASVLLDGDEVATEGVRLVASCASVVVGDRVVVDSYLNMSIVTGVLAWSLDSGLGTATPSSDGLMSASDKAKLDGIQARANYYTLPAATASARGGVRVGSGLRVSGDVLSVDNGAYVNESRVVPVYGLYNPYNTDHHFTISVSERDVLIGLGWSYEGVKFYALSSQA